MELFEKSTGATILEVAFKFHDIESRISEEVGLTLDEIRCLVTTYLRHPSCVSDLNNLLSIDPTRTSKVLKSLEEQKLIKRELDEFDRRKSRIEISGEGKAMSEKILKLANELGKKYLDSISKELLNYVEDH